MGWLQSTARRWRSEDMREHRRIIHSIDDGARGLVELVQYEIENLKADGGYADVIESLHVASFRLRQAAARLDEARRQVRT